MLDLVFSFVDELLSDQTPETVHLMPHGRLILSHLINLCSKSSDITFTIDEIFVSHRKQQDPVKETIPTDKTYPEQFRRLLQAGDHADVTFLLDGGRRAVKAHKAILSARSEYFEAMLRVGGMAESLQSEIAMEHDGDSFRRMLEFIYTDKIQDLEACDAQQILALLLTANQFVMEDLRILCEPRAAKLLSQETIAKFLLLSAGKERSVLREACINYIQDNKAILSTDPNFYREVENNPELGLLLFQYALNPSSNNSYCAGDDENSARKRRRYSDVRENELDLVPPQLNASNTNTIAQNNVSVQDT